MLVTLSNSDHSLDYRAILYPPLWTLVCVVLPRLSVFPISNNWHRAGRHLVWERSPNVKVLISSHAGSHASVQSTAVQWAPPRAQAVSSFTSRGRQHHTDFPGWLNLYFSPFKISHQKLEDGGLPSLVLGYFPPRLRKDGSQWCHSF